MHDGAPAPSTTRAALAFTIPITAEPCAGARRAGDWIASPEPTGPRPPGASGTKCDATPSLPADSPQGNRGAAAWRCDEPAIAVAHHLIKRTGERPPYRIPGPHALACFARHRGHRDDATAYLGAAAVLDDRAWGIPAAHRCAPVVAAARKTVRPDPTASSLLRPHRSEPMPGTRPAMPARAGLQIEQIPHPTFHVR